MSLLTAWFPPSRENWELLMSIWNLFPIFTTVQWFVNWYPAGKTSTESRLNFPGKWAWLTMEVPGFIIILYTMRTLPTQLGLSSLPWQNWALAGLYTLHYINRAILHPIISPSMSPIHPGIWLMALGFNVTNGLAIGGWLAGHGPTSQSYWASRSSYVFLGITLWTLGLAGNIWHDEELREIRRKATRKQRAQAEKQRKEASAAGEQPPQSVHKLYMLPENALFQYIFYPHFLCEWIEWAGFWMVGGLAFTPARTFLLNEITTMLPRALQGKRWYIDRFGRETVGSRRAIFPGLL